MLDLVLLIIAAVCFALVAFDVELLRGRVNLLGLGLLCWVLTALL